MIPLYALYTSVCGLCLYLPLGVNRYRPIILMASHPWYKGRAQTAGQKKA